MEAMRFVVVPLLRTNRPVIKLEFFLPFSGTCESSMRTCPSRLLLSAVWQFPFLLFLACASPLLQPSFHYLLDASSVWHLCAQPLFDSAGLLVDFWRPGFFASAFDLLA